jgi:hypothetical protein
MRKLIERGIDSYLADYHFSPEAIEACRPYAGKIKITWRLLIKGCVFNGDPSPFIEMFVPQDMYVCIIFNRVVGHGRWSIGQFRRVHLAYLDQDTTLSILDDLCQPNTITDKLSMYYCDLEQPIDGIRGELSTIESAEISNSYQPQPIPYLFPICRDLTIDGETRSNRDESGLLTSIRNFPGVRKLIIKNLSLLDVLFRHMTETHIRPHSLYIEFCRLNKATFDALRDCIRQLDAKLALKFDSCYLVPYDEISLVEQFCRSIQFYPVDFMQIGFVQLYHYPQCTRLLNERIQANQQFLAWLRYSSVHMKHVPVEIKRKWYEETVGPWDITFS